MTENNTSGPGLEQFVTVRFQELTTLWKMASYEQGSQSGQLLVLCNLLK